MLTNWKTISGSISRLRKVDETLAGGGQGLTKKERLMLAREKAKLERALGGIKDMGGVPDLLFVIDTNKEALAIKEAQRLGIPVAAIVDTNCDPDGITHVVPANDDAARAIAIYCDLIARAAIDGISRGQGALGVDVGAMESPMPEELPAANVNEAPAAAAASAPEPVEQFERLSAPRGAPDELTKLHGVGPQLEKKLNDAGVYHFWQIAAMQPADAATLDTDLKLNGRIGRDGWVEQARTMLDAVAA
jgi:small subunit ribosomal protein S2